MMNLEKLKELMLHDQEMLEDEVYENQLGRNQVSLEYYLENGDEDEDKSWAPELIEYIKANFGSNAEKVTYINYIDGKDVDVMMWVLDFSDDHNWCSWFGIVENKDDENELGYSVVSIYNDECSRTEFAD